MITTKPNGKTSITITQDGYRVYVNFDEAPKLAADLVDLLLENRAKESREYLLTLAWRIWNFYQDADMKALAEKCTGTFGKSGPECDKCSRYEVDCEGMGEFKC